MKTITRTPISNRLGARSLARDASSSRSSGETGETLVELLVSIMLLGIAGVLMLGGLMTLTASSVYYGDETQVQNTLYDWASTVAAMPYKACAVTTDVPALAASELSGGQHTLTGTVTSVTYWDGATSTFVATCPTSDTGIMRVTISVAAPGAIYTAFAKSLQVVVRKPCVSGC